MLKLWHGNGFDYNCYYTDSGCGQLISQWNHQLSCRTGRPCSHLGATVVSCALLPGKLFGTLCTSAYCHQWLSVGKGLTGHPAAPAACFSCHHSGSIFSSAVLSFIALMRLNGCFVGWICWLCCSGCCSAPGSSSDRDVGGADSRGLCGEDAVHQQHSGQSR